MSQSVKVDSKEEALLTDSSGSSTVKKEAV